MSRSKEHNQKISESLLALNRGKSELKQCPMCKKLIKRDEFKPRNNGFSRAYCGECQKIKSKEYARSLREKSPEYKEKMRVVNIKTCLKKKYGMTLEQWEKMFSDQNGKCAICKTNQKELNKRFSVDHDHITNKVRGLLCNNCNRAIGLLKDEYQILINAAEYIKIHQTK
jgi:hypothetical protein